MAARSSNITSATGGTPLLLITALACWIFSLLPLTANGQNSEAIPNALQGWQQWVLDKHPQLPCPSLTNGQSKRCLWYEPLILKTDDTGISFQWQVENLSRQDQSIRLPGSDKHWPERVYLNGQAAHLSRIGGQPYMWLKPGSHKLQGRINWSSMASSIDISPSTGLVELWLNGQRQGAVNRNQGQLWLKSTDKLSNKTQQDRLSVRVFRNIDDTIPALVETRIELNVSGSERQVTLAPALLADSRAVALNSPLAAKLEQDGNLRVLLKPGSWTITVRGRLLKPLTQLSYAPASADWPQQEVWSYKARPQLHRQRLSGGQAVDPGQLGVPKAWASLPAVLIKPEEQLSFQLEHRGNPNPSANKLELKKKLWLDFDGKGFTQSDTINGELNQGWRLNIQPQNQLGRASLHNKPQLITELDNGDIGIEIHRRNFQLEAISRSDKNHWLAPELSASGWQQNFDAIDSLLQLPPGWSLLHASGVDSVNDSWISKWTLLDIFLLLIIAASVLRLAGPVSAAVALVTLALLFHRPEAPVYIWLNIIAVMALLKVIKGKVASWLEAWLTRYFWASCAILLLIWLPFAIEQIRTAIYPQLEHRYTQAAVLQRPETKAPMPQQQLEEVVVTASKRSNTMAQDDGSFAEYDVEQLAADPSANQRRSKRLGSALSSYADKRQQRDPGRRIQTGPGEPKWTWNPVRLSWQGPVSESQTIKLYLASPWMNSLANILATLLPLILALLLFKPLLRPLRNIRLGQNGGTTAATLLPAILLLGSLAPSPSAQAQLPSAELLDQLEQRLTKPAPCLPHCSSIQKLDIKLDEQRLSMRIQLTAITELAWPLPVSDSGWQPGRIQLNGSLAASYQSGKNWLVYLPKGVHQLELEADIRQLDKLVLDFAEPAHNISLQAPSWRLEGSQQQNQLAQAKSLSLSRVQKNQSSQQQLLQAGPMPAYARIDRFIHLGFDWQIESEIRRLSKGSAIHIELPLLPGESLSDGELKVVDGKIQLKLEPGQQRLRWRSQLKTGETIKLSLPKQNTWLERWRLQADNRWQIQQHDNATPQLLPSGRLWTPQWRPWPGEAIELHISEPKAVKGSYLSFEQVSLQQELGQRSQAISLRFEALSSQGQPYSLDLPEGAELQSLSINGRAIPLGEDKSKLSLDLLPGSQWVEAQWQQPQSLTTKVSSPALNLGALSSNNEIKILLPRDRWPLLVGGPQMGPAVLIWGYLLVIAIVAAGLGRYGGTPIKTYEWLLLGIGIGFNQIFAPVIITAWLLTLAWRGRWQREPSNGAFAAIQILLIVLSLMSLIILIFTITNSLLARPDMHITGNGSYAYKLVWFADRARDVFPQAWVLSLPLWAYRLAMLLWSLWLAFAVLRWLRWGWAQVNHLGLWFKEEGKDTATATHQQQTDNSNNGNA